ncbi:MAG: XRE family transcriptional regulator [Gammaproteobacteria bacterium]|nr:XRE family transcriptional regulator [Gammaproteobacteria bacterium]
MNPETDFRTPGQLIQALLDSRGWTQRVLAIILGVDETGLNKIVAGKRPVDAEMALMLGDTFSVAAERFLELQKSFDLARARIVSRPNPGRATRAHLFGNLPVGEMIKRGWLDADDIRNVPKVEAALAKFFGVSVPDEIEILPNAAKKTSVATPATPAQLAWIYRVREIASEMIVGRYSPSAVTGAVKRLSALLSAPEEARKVPRILAESGIRYVIVESLTAAKIDGVCFWLNDTSPVIGMSLRHDRIDNFWFVLRHELEHVLRLHGRSGAMLDAELEGERAGIGANVPEEERIANEAAANFCVPRQVMDGFIARKQPFFAERDILGFAQTLQIHPGIVAGQLQHRTARYDRFRNHLVRIRSAIAPSAIVDGWGDIAPVEI